MDGSEPTPQDDHSPQKLDTFVCFLEARNMKLLLAFIFVLGIATASGCSTTYIRWMNARGVSQEQFMKDRYACLQETQQRVADAYVNQTGGVATSQVMPTCSAWNSCLAARGYYRADTTNLDDFRQPGSLSVPPGTVVYCR